MDRLPTNQQQKEPDMPNPNETQPVSPEALWGDLLDDSGELLNPKVAGIKAELAAIGAERFVAARLDFWSACRLRDDLAAGL